MYSISENSMCEKGGISMDVKAAAGLYHQPWRLVPNHIRGRGGREIDKFRGMDPGEAKDTGYGSEAWIGSVTRTESPPENDPDRGCSETILPDGRRMYLYQAINENPVEVLGERHMAKSGTGLGMLIKYLDAYQQYGLQCHPTRPWAKKMWNSDYGKEESWYVIGTREDTAEPAYIYLGFKEGITRELFEKYYYEGDISDLENLCHKILVKPGEAYFIGGGCPHALGEGCFVIEVQEPSDITLGAQPITHWRPDIPEEVSRLHDERLLGAYIYDGCSYEENLRRWQIPRKTIREGAWGCENYIIGPDQTSYFSFTELVVSGRTELLRTGFPQVAIVTGGCGRLIFDGGEMSVGKADEIFIPCNVPGLSIEGDVSIVLCNPEGVTYENINN